MVAQGPIEESALGRARPGTLEELFIDLVGGGAHRAVALDWI